MQPRQPPGVAFADLSEIAARPRCRSASVVKHEHRNYGLRVGAYRQGAQPHYYSERRNLGPGPIFANVRR
jgi:hypothetical protein